MRLEVTSKRWDYRFLEEEIIDVEVRPKGLFPGSREPVVEKMMNYNYNFVHIFLLVVPSSKPFLEVPIHHSSNLGFYVH